ncbi:MAG: lysophospholipid acyltransferase family protein [Sandaracinaceae bacterium]
MLDLPRLRRIRLSRKPVIQRLVAYSVLAPNYELFPGITIEMDGAERVPDEPVIIAMNHTDRYNYFPFQYAWWRRQNRFTATWVKGKYYESMGTVMFMELTINLPTVSRGYLISKDVNATLGRRPAEDEYPRLRALVLAASRGESPTPDPDLPRELFERPRDILGRPFDPFRESWPEAMEALYRAMMGSFLDLNENAARLGLDLLIFPQGTRSKRLSQGHIGIAQIAMHLRRTVVPVGCNGTDKVYPGGSPFARAGTVTYRFGEPLTPSDVADLLPEEPFVPFTREAEERHRDAFDAYVERIMERIDGLLDDEYRYSDGRQSEGVQGMDRFL